MDGDEILEKTTSRGHSDFSNPPVEFLNDWLRKNGKGHLQELGRDDEVFIGTFNHLPLGFLQAVAEAPWSFPENAHVFIASEEAPSCRFKTVVEIRAVFQGKAQEEGPENTDF